MTTSSHSIYVVKYRPLNSTREGTRAATRFNIPPFVDGSCRREPDLECRFPSISALCRGRIFAPRLREGDEVVYVTTKDFYGEDFKHWRIVARLRVLKRFTSHQEAALWYRAKTGKVPSNCMVAGNPPLPLSQTSRGASNCARGCGKTAASLLRWNKHYQDRADSIPTFLACVTIWKELVIPPMLTEQVALKFLGNWKRVRSRSPIKITDSDLRTLEHEINQLG